MDSSDGKAHHLGSRPRERIHFQWVRAVVCQSDHPLVPHWCAMSLAKRRCRTFWRHTESHHWSNCASSVSCRFSRAFYGTGWGDSCLQFGHQWRGLFSFASGHRPSVSACGWCACWCSTTSSWTSFGGRRASFGQAVGGQRGSPSGYGSAALQPWIAASRVGPKQNFDDQRCTSTWRPLLLLEGDQI